MPQGHFEETRATARLPNLDIEIVHGRSADGGAERISISLLRVLQTSGQGARRCPL
jgi:hypothetical protein